MSLRNRLKKLEALISRSDPLVLHACWQRNKETGELPEHAETADTIREIRLTLLAIEYRDGGATSREGVRAGLTFEPTEVEWAEFEGDS